MKAQKRGLFFILLIISAFLLAPFIQKIIHFLVIEPVAYYWWGVRRVFDAIPQIVYWYFLISTLGIITFFFMLKIIVTRIEVPNAINERPGPVKSLAESISLTNQSEYFRWLLANRLAKLALELTTSGGGKNVSSKSETPANLAHLQWNPPQEILGYLQAGLDPSSINNRRKGIPILKPVSNPKLAVDPEQAINFLDSVMEQKSD